MQDTGATAIGWVSTAILIVTLARQTVVLWRTDHPEAMSSWLFLGQAAASIGFIVYSAMLDNVVFVVANVLILITAIVGQAVAMARRHERGDVHNRERSASAGGIVAAGHATGR